MILNNAKTLIGLLSIAFLISYTSCNQTTDAESAQTTAATTESKSMKKSHPSDVIPFMDQFKILLGDGTHADNLVNYTNEKFFYSKNDGNRDWVVYKTPNKGVTSPNSSNTRSELHQKKQWTPLTGGKLNGTLKVMQVSTSGDARVAASYSTVVGQIHGADGHENEPIKIFYKKFPGHSKGSVFWNYEINTAGDDNGGRWDYSYPVWGYDMSVVGKTKEGFPPEPKDGIKLGEEFSYEINVYKGIMYVTFTSPGHEKRTFTKNLIQSEYVKKSDIPKQTVELFGQIGQDGTENPTGYKGSMQYFKQGAYNQTNGKSPDKNIVWCAGAEVYGGDIPKQYANGCYTEVWFKSATVGPGTPPQK